MVKVITISREFGSGGRTIGREVAKQLGIPCYDKELIEKIAEESGYAKTFIEEEGEYAPSSNRFAYMFLGRGADGLSNVDHIWMAEKNVIEELAEKESCVIVGRCADYILRNRKDCLNVFIHADWEFKAERIVKQYGESNVEPIKRLKEKDRKRKLNYKYFTEREWGHRHNYHLCLDSGFLGIEQTTELIVNAAGGREKASKVAGNGLLALCGLFFNLKSIKKLKMIFTI